MNQVTQLSPRSHFLTRPQVWIGSEVPEEQNTWIFDGKKMKNIKLNFAPALERLYLEGISNAFNNAELGYRQGINPGIVKVWMDDESIIIKNYGLPIILDKTKAVKGKKILRPEAIFGHLFTSTNFNEATTARTGVGMNGIGAKAINIMSSYFCVTIVDTTTKQKYKGIWQNNMREYQEEIKSTSALRNSTTLEYRVEFNRFGATKYTPELKGLFLRHLIDYSFTLKVPVEFNDEKYFFPDLREFVELYFPDTVKGIYFQRWDPERSPGELWNTKRVKFNPKKHTPIYELAIIDYPGVVLSYCNGMLTHNNGIHVNCCFKEFTAQVRKMVPPELDLSRLKKNISIILSCRVENPKYNSQEKKVLVSPEIYPQISGDIYNKIKKWDLFERLKNQITELAIKKFNSETKKNKGKRLILNKGEDANKAGKKPEICSLYLCEGDSATSYPKKMIALKGGKDFYGYYPLKGVPMNVCNFSTDKFLENKEFRDIMNIMGLKLNVDYKKKENLKELRYHKLIICADADVDGFHITSLLINMFNKYFPSLIELGIVYYFRIYPIKIFKTLKKNGKIERIEVARFSTKREYEDRAHEFTDSVYYVKYYKGLASSSDASIIQDLKNVPIVRFIPDHDCEEKLRLAFDDKKADCRKEWIENFRDEYDPQLSETNVERELLQNITNYIDTNLMLFNISNLHRALPSKFDGLKESQRKILWGAINYWIVKNKTTDCKVAQFASYVAELTAYEHGELSLSKAIIKMAQNFTSTNNLPIFVAEGQFGDRDGGGIKDAPNPRYPFIRLHEWCKKAIPLELVRLIPLRKNDGVDTEPEFIPCIVPLVLINGTLGMATGYSSNIPNHNPIEIIDYLIQKCSGIEPDIILEPYYVKFKGTIQVGDKIDEYDIEKITELAEKSEKAEVLSETKQNVRNFKTFGKYKVGKHNIIKITELPIGRWFKVYRTFLEQLMNSEPKLLEDFEDNCNVMTNTPKYTLYGFKPEINHKNLGLVKSFPLSNMYLIDINGVPVKAKNVYEIIEMYYDKMITVFSLLGDKIIQDLEEKIQYLILEIKFLKLLASKKIITDNKSLEEIYQAMENYEIPKDLLDKLKLSDRSEDKIKEREKKLEKLESELEIQKNLTPQKRWISRLCELKTFLIDTNWENSY